MSNYYLNNYSSTLRDSYSANADKTIFGLEKNVIKRLNEYNDAYFKLGTCKYIVQNLPSGVTITSNRLSESASLTRDISNVFYSRDCNNGYTYSLQSGTNNTYNITKNLTTETDNLEKAVDDLKKALNETNPKRDKNKYDASMNYINNLVAQINNLRGEYDPKLQDIIENSNRSVSQQSIDSAAYIGVIMSIGLASLLFFTFVRSS